MRIIGGKPNKVNPKLIIKECKRIKTIMKIMTFMKKLPVADYTYPNQVIDFFKQK